MDTQTAAECTPDGVASGSPLLLRGASRETPPRVHRWPRWVHVVRHGREGDLIRLAEAEDLMHDTVILEKEADGGYVATVPALPGCVSQGDTRDEVIVNIREAAELYIEDCVENGDPVPQEDGREYIELQTAT